MNNELAVRAHNELAAPTTIREAMQIGQIFAQSGLFQDVRGEAQAIVKIMAGAEIGLPPFQAMNALHIIQGKPTMSANTVAMLLKRSGKYDYRIREWSDTICRIEFFQHGESLGEASFSMDDANKAQLTKNPMWQKYKKPMLFSRALTMGARAHAADVFGGAIYTPEEMGATVDGDGNVLSVPQENDDRQQWEDTYETLRVQAVAAGIPTKPLLEGTPVEGIKRWCEKLKARIEEKQAEKTPLGQALENKHEEATQHNPVEEAVFERDEVIEAELVEEAPKREMPPHIKSVFAAAKKAGLDASDAAGMIAGINIYLDGSEFQPIESRKEITPSMASHINEGIKSGALKW